MLNSPTSTLVRHLIASLSALFLCTANFPVWAQSDVVFLSIEQNSSGRDHVVRFDDGVESFSTEVAPGNYLWGITSINGMILVGEYGINPQKIHKMSPNGTYLGSFTSEDFLPYILESDSDSNVYATSFGPSIARRFDSAGKPRQTFWHPDFSAPTGIDADANGNVYITDVANHLLYKFSSDGEFIVRTPLDFRAVDIAIDEDSNLLYAVSPVDSERAIKVFDIEGILPTYVGYIATPEMVEVSGVHVSATTGNIFVVEFGSHLRDPRGLEYMPNGELIREFRPADVYRAYDITTLVPEQVVPEPSSVLSLTLGISLLVNGRLYRDS